MVTKNKRKNKRKKKKGSEAKAPESESESRSKAPKEPTKGAGAGPEQAVDDQEQDLAKQKRQEEVELLRRFMVKRDQDRILGIQAMRRHEFDKARVHFENYLKFSAIDDADTVHNVLHNLIVCRLQGINKQENLERCVKDCGILLSRAKSDMSVHLAKINALTRLLDFQGASKAIRIAVEEDQKQNLELLHSFMYGLSDASNKTKHQCLSHKFDLPASKEDLKKTYLSLTLPSRQNLFSFTWDQLHEAIDSELGASMIPDNARPRIQKFLHKCLDYNIIPTENRESQLYFFKQELGCLLAQTLWNHFELPDVRPECDTPLEKFFIVAESANTNPNNTMSILSEHGMYFAHEGSEFVSSACLDSISLMTHIFSVSPNEKQKKLFVNVSQLYDVGFDLIYFLAHNTHGDYDSLKETASAAANATDEDWDQFAEFRIKWHERLDLKAIETLTPPKDTDDPKYFENRLEDVLGKEKTRQLLKVEFDASKPILEKYAEIISEISGIDQDTILAELTDEDDFLDNYGATSEETESTTTASTENSSEDEQGKEKPKYEPIGISLLVQSTQFDLKPSGSADNTYDKQKILTKLKVLEKEVVQFQIDYKKIVFDEAKEKAAELRDVMSNISFKGLELTKWLRGFVHYMLERRDIEQELLDYCGAENAAGWSAWFENLGVSMSAAQSIVMCLICRLFVSNIFHTHVKQVQEAAAAAPPEEEVASAVGSEDDAGVSPTESEAEPVEEKNAEPVEEEKTPPEPVEEEKNPEPSPPTPTDTEDVPVKPLPEPVVQRITEPPEIPGIVANLPRFCPSAGHRIENRNETYRYINEVNDISQPLMADLSKIKKALLPPEVPEAINNWLETSVTSNPDLPQKIQAFKEKLGVQKLIIPCVNVQLPVNYILKFLGTGYNYHKEVADFAFLPVGNDDLRVMTLMLDRALTSQETLFHLVYSSADQKVLGFPTRRSMGMPSIVLCQNCDKLFGTLHCQKCSVAHYCSRECQVAKWENHRTECKQWRALGDNIAFYTL